MSAEIAILDVVKTVVVAGGIMGVLGQSVRSIVGVKKLRDNAEQSDDQFAGQFSLSRLLTSLLAGFVAGVLTAFFMSDEQMKLVITKEMLIGFMAAGYAGADIIEGFAKKIIPAAQDHRVNVHKPAR